MRKFLTLMLTLLLSAIPCFADLAGYTIEDYKFSGVYRQNNTVDVYEEITVNFFEKRHGIYRSIASRFYIDVNKSADGTVTKEYKTKLKNIEVFGDEFEYSQEDGVHTIKIGSASRYLTGRHVYKISYTYVMPDDRYDRADFIYYSVLGSEWNVPIQHFSFKLKFENGIPAAENFQVYSGPKFSTENELHVQLLKDKDTIFGELENVSPNSAITLFSKIYEGYFENEIISNNNAIVWVLFGIASAFVLAFLILILIARQKKVVPTVEFHPPEGLSSAEVGILIDGTVDKEDLASLIPWLAYNGYISIEDKEDDLRAKKIRELDEDAPEYQKLMFEALFGEGDEISLESPPCGFGEKVMKVSISLRKYYKRQKPVYMHENSTRILMLVNAVLVGLFLSNNSAIGPMENFLGFITTAIIFLLGNGMRKVWLKKFFSKGKFIVRIVVTVFVAALVLLFNLALMEDFEPVVSEGLSFLLLLLSSIANLIACRRIVQTDWNVEMTGKLLGLKKFIKTAEIDQLRMLVDESPEYFYDILPYAMVFKLTDKWTDLFKNLTISKPVWYHTSNHQHWNASEVANRFAGSVNDSFASSISSGSSSSGGGGGFSGGGGGGGGGGSW